MNASAKVSKQEEITGPVIMGAELGDQGKVCRIMVRPLLVLVLTSCSAGLDATAYSHIVRTKGVVKFRVRLRAMIPDERSGS